MLAWHARAYILSSGCARRGLNVSGVSVLAPIQRVKVNLANLTIQGVLGVKRVEVPEERLRPTWA